MIVRVLGLLIGLATAGAAHAALTPDPFPPERRVLSPAARVARMAKEAFPVPLITMRRGVRSDGWIVYVFRLDMENVPGAPAATMDVTLSVAPDVPLWVMPYLIQKAADGAERTIERLRARAAGADAPTATRITPVVDERVLY